MKGWHVRVHRHRSDNHRRMLLGRYRSRGRRRQNSVDVYRIQRLLDQERFGQRRQNGHVLGQDVLGAFVIFSDKLFDLGINLLGHSFTHVALGGPISTQEYGVIFLSEGQGP